MKQSARTFGMIALLAVLAGCGAESPPPANVVVVVLDTVRRDVTGSDRNELFPGGLTPRLDALAETGTTFSNAWGTAPWTVPSHVSMFTGLLPSVHQCTSVNPRFSDQVGPTLAEAANAAGYETAAFFSNPWLADRTSGLLRGFSKRVEATLSTDGSEVDHGVSSDRRGYQGGPKTLDNVEDWLSSRDPETPFFLFVNFLEAHLPYDPPVEQRRIHVPDVPEGATTTIEWSQEYNAGLHPHDSIDWETVRGLYAADVATADALLGNLLDTLEARGDLENALVIVTSDHGENLGDHHLMGHHFSVHETLLALPLVVRGGSLDAGARDEPVLNTDVFATVLDFIGDEDTARPEQSRSLFASPAPDASPRVLYAQYSPPRALLQGLAELNPSLSAQRVAPSRQTIRVGNARLTMSSNGAVMLHDMSKDPKQETDLASDQAAVVQQLQGILAQYGGSAPGMGDSGAPGLELDEQTREQLRSLGYIR